MVVTTTAGLALLATSTLQIVRHTPTFNMRRNLYEVFDLADIQVVDDKKHVTKPKIRKLRKTIYGFTLNLELPKGYTVEQFRKALPVIEQATSSQILTKHLRGREVELQLGCIPVEERMDYDRHLMITGRPTVPYHTAFGVKHIDFWDDACCHLIAAGATRMGKTVFLRLLFTNIMLSMGGNVQFFYINNKVEDYYPMQGIPQIPEPAEDVLDAIRVMHRAKEEVERRKAVLRKSRDCVNVQMYREKYPNENMPPMFIVFDEFGRFTDEDKDNKEAKLLQQLVMEIAETAGYLDVHLVIATQRPDATTVLKPRIRANILTRVCFQTADEKNSEIVIHTGSAAHLDRIKGRAIVLDGMPAIGQVPYVSEDQTAYLLSPFRRDGFDVEPERSDDTDVLEPFSGFKPRPLGGDDLPRRSETVGNRQPVDETTGPGRPHTYNPKTKGRVLSLHAESCYHPPTVHQVDALSSRR